MEDNHLTEVLTELKRRALEKDTSVGFNPTGIPGLSVVVRTQAGEKRSFSRPYLAIVLQGKKRTQIGQYEYVNGPGDCIITCIDFPSVTYIEEASPETPFVSVVMELNRALLTELALSLAPRREPLSSGDTPPYAVFPCSADLGENALRLFDIADKPEAVQLLAPILIREMHARLLLGEAGTWLWSICAGSQHLQQISHAIAVIKENFRTNLSVETLASSIGMSSASFHRHFKALTGYSPIQYQKTLRLYEARRLLMADRKSVGFTAGAVGYASSSQLTNDYRRFFGVAPRDDRHLNS